MTPMWRRCNVVKRPWRLWVNKPRVPLMTIIIATTRMQYSDVIMGAMAPQNISLTIVYSTVYSGANQRKHQSSASLTFVRGIPRSLVNSPHKWPVTRKMFPFDDVIMMFSAAMTSCVVSEMAQPYRGFLQLCRYSQTFIRTFITLLYTQSSLPCSLDADTIAGNWWLTERPFCHLERTVLGKCTFDIGYRRHWLPSPNCERNTDWLSVETPWTNFNGVLKQIRRYSVKKLHLK